MFGSSTRHERNESRVTESMVDLAEDAGFSFNRFRVFKILGGLVLLIWLALVIFPNFVVTALVYLGLSKITAALVGFIFFQSLYLGYTIIRYFFEDIEENRLLENTPFASVDYQRASGKRFGVWIAAVLSGVANTAGMIGAAFLLDAYGWFLFDLAG